MKAGFPVSGCIWKPVSRFPAVSESYMFPGFRLYMKAICFPVSGCIWKLYVSHFPAAYESYMFAGFRLYIHESYMFPGFRLYIWKLYVSRFPDICMKAICFPVSGCIWKLSFLMSFQTQCIKNGITVYRTNKIQFLVGFVIDKLSKVTLRQIYGFRILWQNLNRRIFNFPANFCRIK